MREVHRSDHDVFLYDCLQAPAFPVAADSKSRAGDDKLAQTFEALMS